MLAAIPSRARRILGLALLASSVSLLASADPTWSERGPVFGGRLSAIVATDSGRTLLVASPGGGVWRSTNSGATWSFPKNDGLADLSVLHLEWDVVDARRLYALTWSGLYVSTNRAESWKALVGIGGEPVPLAPPQASLSDPRPFAQLRLATNQRAVFAATACSGLYYSLDGNKFERVWPFSGESNNPDNCIASIAADPVTKRVYFATLQRGKPARVFRSTCAWAPGKSCLTWEPANDGLPDGTVVALAAANVGGTALVLQMQAPALRGTTTFTTDDGEKWTQVGNQERGWSPRALVHVGTGRDLCAGNVSAAYSSDLGHTWHDFAVSNQHSDIRSVFVDTVLGRVWTTSDGTASGDQANITEWNWRPGQQPSNGRDLGHAGIKAWQMYYATVVQTSGNHRRVFAGSQDNGVLCSDDLGAADWTPRGAAAIPGSGDAFAMRVAPSNINRAYSFANEESSFIRSTNVANAKTCADVKWTAVQPQFDPPSAVINAPQYWSHNALAVHPHVPDEVGDARSHADRELGDPEALVASFAKWMHADPAS